MSQELLDEFRRDRDRYYDQACHALECLADNATGTLAQLVEDRTATQTIAGNVLNALYWHDAERALVRYCDARTVVALMEAEAARDEVPGTVPLDLPGDEEADLWREAARDLSSGAVWRVELTRALRPHPTRIVYVRADDESEATAEFRTKIAARNQVAIISARLATEEDVPEYLEVTA